MADTETTKVAPQPPAPEAVAEMHPPIALEKPEVPEEPAPEPKDEKKSLPGWPLVRFHPVFGRKEFADPYEAAEFGQDDSKGDWRFKTAEAADLARTDTEAGMVIANNMRTKLGQHDEAKTGVVRNSVAAQESLDSGHNEPL